MPVWIPASSQIYTCILNISSRSPISFQAKLPLSSKKKQAAMKVSMIQMTEDST
jgi:hypothetical protein